MVIGEIFNRPRHVVLSVLALSSRFDGQTRHSKRRTSHSLSVLALSSRFDGRIPS